MSLEPTTNFKDSNGADLGSKLITKDYFISVYSSLGENAGIPPELWGWGSGSNGVLGTNLVGGQFSTPITTFAGGNNWKQVDSGTNTSAAIKTDGTLWTWGAYLLSINWSGSSSTYAYTPRLLSYTYDWNTVSTSGIYRTYGIKTDGTLWGWGSFLGNATGGSLTPVTTFAGGTNWKQVSTARYHTAAIKTDGTLWTWGDNASGYLLGRIMPESHIKTPVTIFGGGSNWADTATGAAEELYTFDIGPQIAMGIKTDGTLWVWGNTTGNLGVLDNSHRNTPVTTFAGGNDWKQISNSGSVSAGIKTSGALWTWGEYGTLFPNPVRNTPLFSTPVTTFAGGNNWADTATGAAEELYTLTVESNGLAAIKTDGTLWIWGDNSTARGGNNSDIEIYTPVTTFAGGTNWKQIDIGSNNTVGIKTDGTLWVWGANGSGQLGTNDILTKSTPVTTFAGGTNWKQISTGVFNSGTVTAGIKTDGTLWTWGLNTSGQLANNETSNKSTPITTFTGGTNWKQVSVGANITAAIKTDGTLWTWGNKSYLGKLTINTISTPVTTFAGGNNWADTATGAVEEFYTLSAGGAHSAAIKTDGTLWAWGSSNVGQVGTTTTTIVPVPVTTFAGGTNWKQLSTGHGNNTAAIKTDGTLWVWGNNSNRQLGINATGNKSTPITTFAGGTDWKQVSINSTSCAAIKTDGTLWTWGANTNGILGNNLSTTTSTPITTFAGGNNWKQVSMGTSNCAAIKTDGTLWVWGSRSIIGITTLSIISTPITTFAGGNNWTDTATGAAEELYTLSAGITSSAAIKTDGTLWTWGNQSSLQLGIPNTVQRTTPVTTFAGGTDWKQVDVGSTSCAAIKTDGTLWGWGVNTTAQLGTNDLINKSTPVTTFAGGTDWKQVSNGTSTNTAAIKTDGTLWVWGTNTDSRLGTNDAINKSTPVTTFAGGTDWKQVSIGSNNIAAIKTDGTLWTWGNNATGQLGTYDVIFKSTPVTTFAGGTDWKQVSAGIQHVVAIKTDGSLWTWGLNSLAQLGTNDVTIRSTPVTTFAGGTNWKQVCAGSSHNTAVKTDGTLWTWGFNTSGQLGTNDTNNKSTPVTTFAGGTNWKQASAGGAHTIALKNDGVNKELYVFGNNQIYQTGFEINNAAPTNITPNATDWKYVSTGGTHITAVKTDGTLWVWGNNGTRQLGTNDTINKSTPVTTFAGGNDWKQVCAGITHTTAVKTDGTLWVWGSNTYAKLGTNDNITKSTPVTTFAGGINWKQVSAGYNHTLALKNDGVNKELYVFGNNIVSQLAAEKPSYIPDNPTPSESNWKQVSAKDHIAAIKTDNTLWVWGPNSLAQLGINDTTTRSTPVTTFAGGTDWKQVSAGTWSTAAVKIDGTLWVWGYNGSGNLGTNDVNNRSTPVTTFAGGSNWKQVSASLSQTMALKDDGVNKQLYVFGNNTYSLGVEYKTSLLPSKLGVTEDWKQVSVGLVHAAAVKTDGTLWTWGNNGSHQLGINANFTRTTPVTTFAGGTDWKQISVGTNHTASVKTDGTLWIWGSNSFLQLGNNQNTTRSTPVTTFAGGNDWKQVSCGEYHTAAIKTDGTLWIWGDNGSGQLGAGVITNRSTPITTFAGGTDWKQVCAGNTHTTAVKTDGTLWTWGSGGYGKLGTNDTINRNTPITTFAGGNNWKQVSASTANTLALKDDGINKQLYVFGSNNDINSGTNNSIAKSAQYPSTTFAGGTNWKQVSVGLTNTAAVKTDGTLWVWGENDQGQIGNNSVLYNIGTPVTTFAGGTNWKQVSCGNSIVGAVKKDGGLWMWGSPYSGGLGVEYTDRTYTSTPVTTFAGGNNWAHTTNDLPEELYTISAGEAYYTDEFAILAIKTDGTLWTWGNSYNLTVGTGGYYASTPVTTFAGGTNWKQVASCALTSAAIKTDGTLWVWGDNNESNLGIGFDLRYVSTPVTTFAGGTNWKQVSCSYSATAAIKTDGSLWIWGDNINGQLGINNENFGIDTPVTTFAGGTDWKQVSCGGYLTSAIKTDGTLWTWGANFYGDAGINDFPTRPITPVTTFAGGTDWKQVSVSMAGHVCAIKTDGTLWGWGSNSQGQLGNAQNGWGLEVPTPVTTFAGGNDWKQVSAGGWLSDPSSGFTTAIKNDGTLWTWGYGEYGQLGNSRTGYAATTSTPVTTFAGGTNWRQVSAGGSFTLGLKTDGTLHAFGSTSLLAVEYYPGYRTPVTTFAGGNDWKSVNCFRHTSGIKTDGTLWMWGSNFNGQLGTNDTIFRVTPTTIFAGGNNWKQISLGESYTLAIKPTDY